MITISARYHRQFGGLGSNYSLNDFEDIEKIPFFIFSVEGIIFFSGQFFG